MAVGVWSDAVGSRFAASPSRPPDGAKILSSRPLSTSAGTSRTPSISLVFEFVVTRFRATPGELTVPEGAVPVKTTVFSVGLPVAAVAAPWIRNPST